MATTLQRVRKIGELLKLIWEKKEKTTRNIKYKIVFIINLISQL